MILGHGMVGSLALQPLAARSDHVVADDIGVDIEIAAQFAVEGFDVPDVDDGALRQAVAPA